MILLLAVNGTLSSSWGLQQPPVAVFTATSFKEPSNEQE